MAEINLPEELQDAAALYVLGRLDAPERAEFELRMESSSELRAFVRDLEHGAVAIVHSLPQRPPPADLWKRIESAVRTEIEPPVSSVPLWRIFFRSGWAAAAACVVVFGFYITWTNQSTPLDSESSQELKPSTAKTRVHSTVRNHDVVSAQDNNAAAVDEVRAEALAHAAEFNALRRRIAELENEVALMSKTLAEANASPAAPGQFTIQQMIPVNADGTPMRTVALPSAELQEALFLAIAREMGWSTNTRPILNGARSIQFIDLSGANRPASAPDTAESQRTQEPGQGGKTAPVEEPPSSQLTADATQDPAPNLPMFVMGNNAYVAVDSAQLPPNSSEVTVWAGSSILMNYGTLSLVDGITIFSFSIDTSLENLSLSLNGGAGMMHFRATNSVPVPLNQPNR